VTTLKTPLTVVRDRDGNELTRHECAEIARRANLFEEMVAKIQCVVTAWDRNEIGQLDGDIIDELRDLLSRADGRSVYVAD
jgi:hypothetical protein